MKVKNISADLIIIAGVKIRPNEIKELDDFGSTFDYANYESEFLTRLDNGEILFLDETDTVIDNRNTIVQEFESITENSGNSIITYDESFYYDYKTFNMALGDVIETTYQGYLKTLDFIVDSGEVSVQVINPLMNKIDVFETNNYAIDADYKLFCPTIRLTAKSKSACKLYLDGTYYSTDKTKEQYLSEIYSYSKFPTVSFVDSNNIKFKTNFKRNMINDYFLDTVGNNIGYTYNNATLRNFNKFEDGAYVAFYNTFLLNDLDAFTFNIWFNLEDDISNKQYIMYKQDVFEMYVQNGVLYFYIGKSGTRYQVYLNSNTWEMFTITNSQDNYYVYMKDKLITSFTNSTGFEDKNDYIYFGGKGNSYGIRSGEIGEVALYDYHFSAGMVSHLYMHNHPMLQIQTNLITGCFENTYTHSSSLDMTEAYQFNIVEKEYAKIGNLVQSERLTKVESTSDEQYLTVVTGKIHIPEDGKYQFKYTGDGKYNLKIDDKVILCNSDSDMFYMEEGYYSFRLTCFCNTYKVQYKEQHSADYIDIDIKLEDTQDTDTTTDYSLYFDAVARTSNYDLVFSGFAGTEYDCNSSITNIDNFDDNILSNRFTIDLDITHDENNALVFGQGSESWNPNFEIRINNNKLAFKHHGAYLESKTLQKFQKHNVQITSNGNKIFMYVNGALDNSCDFYENTYYASKEKMSIGAMAQDYNPSWGNGDFTLHRFKWYLTYFTQDAIINNYASTR